MMVRIRAALGWAPTDLTVTFVARETITVPAGTFETARIQIQGTYENASTLGGQPFEFGSWTTTLWLAEGIGRVAEQSNESDTEVLPGGGTDQENSSYRFELTSTSLGDYIDLTGEINSNVNLPAQVVAGDNTKIPLPLEVTNNGSRTVPNGTNISVHVVARPIGGGDDVDVATFDDLPIGGLTARTNNSVDSEGFLATSGS